MSNGVPHNHHPEDLLRDAAGSFSAAPAPEVWAGIQQALQKKNKRRRFIWFFILPLALAPVFIFSGNFFGKKQPAPLTHTIKQTETAPNRVTGNENSNTASIQELVHDAPVKKDITAPVVSENPSLTGTVDNNDPVTGMAISTPRNTRPNKITFRKKEYIPAYFASTNNNRVRIQKNKARKPVSAAIAPATGSEQQETTITGGALPEPEKITTPEPAEQQVTEPSITGVPENIPAQPATTNDKPETQNITQPEANKEQAIVVKLPRRKLRFGFNINLGAGYRLLQPGANSEKSALNRSGGGTGDKALSDLQQQPIGVYGAGVTVSKQLSGRWGIETGIGYHLQGYNSVVYETNGPVPLGFVQPQSYILNPAAVRQNFRYVSNPNYAATSVIGQTRLKNRYHFLKVPVLATFQSNAKNRQSVFVKAGVSVQYLLNKNNYVYSPGVGNFYLPPSTTFRNIHLAGVVQPGFLFRLKNNRELHLGLNMELNLLPLHTPAVLYREYLFNAGFKLTYLLR